MVGVAGILAGVLAFVWPGMTALVLLMFVATWAIIIGVLQIGARFNCARKWRANGCLP